MSEHTHDYNVAGRVGPLQVSVAFCECGEMKLIRLGDDGCFTETSVEWITENAPEFFAAQVKR